MQVIQDRQDLQEHMHLEHHHAQNNCKGEGKKLKKKKIQLIKQMNGKTLKKSKNNETVIIPDFKRNY
jgi:hypothetical protein